MNPLWIHPSSFILHPSEEGPPMFPTMRRCFPVLFVAALATALSAGPAQAQRPLRQAPLAALQQQTAWLQQQTAVQAAVQQTNLLLQSAKSGPAPGNTQNGAAQQAGTPNSANLQQQEIALQIAL